MELRNHCSRRWATVWAGGLLAVGLAGCGTNNPPGTNVCSGPVGEQHALELTSSALARHYYLYVPASYDCSQEPWPLLIDFHGTASGDESDNPEEYYALPGMKAEADAQHFIVARPRSLFDAENGENIYQWDIHPGDLALNVTFAHDLVKTLEAEYHIDPTRVYAAGFSNGTNMVSQFLGDSPPVFRGIAVIGGGVWTEPASVNLGSPTLRIYAATGYREYLYPYHTELMKLLSNNALPAANIFVRATNAGHELYGWHYRELFDWLDANKRPGAGTLAAHWSQAGIGTTDDLLKLAPAPDGSLLVGANNGNIYRRASLGASWSNVGHISGTDAQSATTVTPNLAGLCVDGSGHGVAVGNGVLAGSTDGGASWQSFGAIPPFGIFGFTKSEFFTITCTPSVITGGGYTAIGYSEDGGNVWQAGSGLGSAGFPGQLNTSLAGPSGTVMAGGYYDYMGRSTDSGRNFTAVNPPAEIQWWNGFAAAADGNWWAVGEAGTIAHSSDDGVDWGQQTNTSTEDLYAVAFATTSQGLAVGAHGAALYTNDGGVTWQDVSTGLDGYLGDVTWQADGTALAVGAGGALLTFSPPN